ncbi:Protein of unknown function (DUF3060) [Mycolicibacterium chubuense NBB4]|uniref:DUF3060 domain-containing protein n=1 Tax=Mycolicibacterium chubuense (strain NBB4) TaxID=710421 RepID=I4BEH3_MYCCN|nr:DUF3060 domain-containing protein [Mycolicibacterium chubuense]AFM15680.1 Protein of unknown function (DUF3060) [Mycolicibacterium chubuense NBB4]
MEPFGDPEARIRDLERPLTDQARATELGTRPFEAALVPVPGPVPQPHAGQPFPQDGSPYYAPPRQIVRKRSTVTAQWLIPAVAGVVLVAGVIGVVTVVTVAKVDRAVAPRPVPVAPGMSGGGGSVAGGVPTAQAPVGGAASVPTVAAGATLSIGGVDKHQTVLCDHGAVGVSGVNNTIDIQGSCGTVTVSGMNNVITVEAAGAISASGFDNKVTYRGGTPQISRSGSGNVVAQG